MTVTRRDFSVVTNVSGTNNNVLNVTRHVDLQDGDLLIAVTNGPVGTITPPAGWTLLGSAVAGAGTQSNLFRKIASSEPATWTFTWGVTSSVNVAVVSFMGHHDVLQWDYKILAATAGLSGHDMDAARDCIGYCFAAWRDGTTNTLDPTEGLEDFDTAAANTGSTIFRGMGGSAFSAGDIINIGDALPGIIFNSTNPVDNAVVWTVFVDNVAKDTEAWPTANGAFNVELKLDEVQLDSLGGISTAFRGDITGDVVAFGESGENPPGEVTEKLADGLNWTKWLTFADSGYVQYDLGVPTMVRRYRLQSALDAPERDPRNWILKGSNDGSNFTNIDPRQGVAFNNRSETQEYKIALPGTYRYYRLDISSNRAPTAANSTQLAQWRLSSHDVWEDITTYVNEESKIRITRGLQGSSGRSDFSRAYFELNNTDGRFSTRNQDGVYFGSLKRNTQNRISKAFGSKSLQLQGDVQLEGTNMCGDGMRTVLTSALTITSDIDIAVDFEPRSWRDEQMLCGIATTSTDNTDPKASWSLYMDASGQLNMLWSPQPGTVTATSTVAVPQSTRLAVRVTVDMDNGASGNTTTFYTAPTIAGPWTQLGDTVVNTGTSSIGYNGGALCVGHVGSKSQRGINGSVYAFQLRSSIGGTLVSNADFTAQANGSYQFTENSNMWVAVNNAVISNRRYRFHGEVAEWPISWDPTGNWVTASVTGAGVQKRMEQVQSAQSTMRRYHTKGVIQDPGAFERFADPDAYWPMEDEAGAFELASGLPAKPGMQVYGSPEFAANSDFNESAPLIKMGTTKFGGRVAGNGNEYIDIRWIMTIPSDPVLVAQTKILELYGTGMCRHWIFYYEAANTVRVRGFDENDDGTPAKDTGNQTATIVGEAVHCQLILETRSGSFTVDLTFTATDVFGTVLSSWTAPFLVSTVGRIYRINVNPEGQMADASVGHVAAYGRDTVQFAGGELNAHHYETAGNRMKRLCAEEQTEFRHVGDLNSSAFLGYAEIETPFASMSSGALSDGGFLIDPLDAFGIEYRTVRSMFNQAPHITLSYSNGELSGSLNPVADDAYIVNDFTAERGGAGSARYQSTTGELSANLPPDGVGPYEQSQSYSLAHEGQCVDIASWEVHKGTLDEERFTQITLALENRRIAANPALAEQVIKLDVGDRVDITDTPSFLTKDDIRQIVIGYEEWFDNFQHQVSLNTLPERSFEVAEYDSGYHHDTDGAYLYQDITAVQTDFEVEASNGPGFSEEPIATPYDIRVDGEVMRVIAIGRMFTSNSTFETNVTGWTGINGATLTWDGSVFYPHNLLSTASMKLTPDGVTAGPYAAHDLSGVATVTPQMVYKSSAWVYCATAVADIRPRVAWYDAAGVFISFTSTLQAIPAGIWTYIENTHVAPATASQARTSVFINSTPSAAAPVWIWDAQISDYPAYNSGDQGDSFNRANSTTVLGSTDRGEVEAWTQNSGTWGINGNAAYISAAATSIATIVGSTDFERVQFQVTTWPAATVVGLVFRFVDTSNFWWWGGTVGSAATLNSVVAGVTTTYTPDSGAGGDYILAANDILGIEVHGSAIIAYRNGQTAMTMSSTASQAGTRVGMRLTAITPRIDDFYFKDNVGPSRLQVERGKNGAAATHKGLAGVSLYKTPARGL